MLCYLVYIICGPLCRESEWGSGIVFGWGWGGRAWQSRPEMAVGKGWESNPEKAHDNKWLTVIYDDLRWWSSPQQAAGYPAKLRRSLPARGAPANTDHPCRPVEAGSPLPSDKRQGILAKTNKINSFSLPNLSGLNVTKPNLISLLIIQNRHNFGHNLNISRLDLANFCRC